MNDEPEQSLQRALAEIPPLDPTIQDTQSGMGRYLPIGVDAGRQEWVIRWTGELFADKLGLKLLGRDAAHLIWPGRMIRFRFGSGDPPDFRERRGATEQSLLDGWLPVIISRWQDREFSFEQTAFATLLDGPLTPPAARRGDEPVVAMLRFVIRNTTHARKHTRLWMQAGVQEAWELREGLVIAHGRVVPAEPVARQWRVDPYGEAPLRCAIHSGGKGSLAAVGYSDQPGAAQAIPSAIAYDIELNGGEVSDHHHGLPIHQPGRSRPVGEDRRPRLGKPPCRRGRLLAVIRRGRWPALAAGRPPQRLPSGRARSRRHQHRQRPGKRPHLVPAGDLRLWRLRQ